MDELCGTKMARMRFLVESVLSDYITAKAGGKLAATRVRVAMSEIKALAFDIRQEILPVIQKKTI